MKDFALILLYCAAFALAAIGIAFAVVTFTSFRLDPATTRLLVINTALMPLYFYLITRFNRRGSSH